MVIELLEQRPAERLSVKYEIEDDQIGLQPHDLRGIDDRHGGGHDHKPLSWLPITSSSGIARIYWI